MSKELGYGNYEADMAYNFVDLTLSAGSMANPTLKPGAFKLFRYIDTDFITTWKLMTPSALFTEGFLDTVTIYSTYDSYNNENKND